MKSLFSILFLFTIWNAYSQDIPLELIRNNQQVRFLKYDTKSSEKEFKIKEFIKAINQCDTSFFQSSFGAILKNNSIDWIIQQGYDTSISILDLNNDKTNDLIFSYCNACDDNQLLIFLNNGSSYSLGLEGFGCIAKIDFKNNFLTRLTTLPCQCCADQFFKFEDYFFSNDKKFLFSNFEYSFQENDFPEKTENPIDILLNKEECIYPTADCKKSEDFELLEIDSVGNNEKKVGVHFEYCFEKIPSGTKIKVLGTKNKSRFIMWEKEKDKYILGWIK
jgi:hypothetical protein